MAIRLRKRKQSTTVRAGLVIRMDEPSNALRAVDVLRRLAPRRQPSTLAEDVAESLKDWKRWAESYLESQA
jgi:hypothetical protein